MLKGPPSGRTTAPTREPWDRARLQSRQCNSKGSRLPERTVTRASLIARDE